jgi:hypothetical protein
MKEGVASFVVTKKRMPDGRVYESPRIYLPTKLTTDSNFPFAKAALRLYVKVSGNRLLVERAAPDILKRFGRPKKKRIPRTKKKRKAKRGKN